MYRKRCIIRNIRSKERKETPITSFPYISRVPFPPEISVEDIIHNRTDQNRRSPNNYFLYRLAYMKELKKWTNTNIDMRLLSPFISRAWKNESREVKERYKEISNEIKARLEDDRKKNPVYVYENLSESTVHNEIIDFVKNPVITETTETLPYSTPPSFSPYDIMPHSYYPVYIPDSHQMNQNIILQDFDDPYYLSYN